MNEFDLNIGTNVFCHGEDKCGTLAKVAVHPDRRQVTHLIVEKGFFLKRARVFPLDDLERATPQGLYLSVGTDALENYPEYKEFEVEEPAPGYPSMSGTDLGGYPSAALTAPMVREKVRQGIAPGLLVLERGIPVKNIDTTTIGKFHHVLVTPADGAITHLVVEHGFLAPTRHLVPISMIEYMGEQSITADLTEDELSQLPHYDAEHLDEIVNNDQENGQAGTTGELTLTNRVMTALMSDPLTENAVIEIIEDRGVITLQGHVDNPEIREAAKRLAREQPGVIAVHDEMKIVG